MMIAYVKAKLADVQTIKFAFVDAMGICWVSTRIDWAVNEDFRCGVDGIDENGILGQTDDQFDLKMLRQKTQ